MIMNLAARIMANATNVIANISSARFENFTAAWGGNDPNFTSIPDWEAGLWSIAVVYPDTVGQIAWFILFSIPFLMMWINHSDMLPAAIVGIFMGLYIIGFVGTQYFGIGIALIALAVTSVVWSVWIRRI